MYNANKAPELLELENVCAARLMEAGFEDININITKGPYRVISRLSGHIKASKNNSEHEIKFGDISLKDLPISTISTICLTLTSSIIEGDTVDSSDYMNKVIRSFDQAGFSHAKWEYTYGASMPSFLGVLFGYEGAIITADYYIEDMES